MKPVNKTLNFVTVEKDYNDNVDRKNIYWISCDNCQNVYIGRGRKKNFFS